MLIQCAGLLDYFTNLKNLKLIAFLGDLLFSFKRFQEKLQSDHLTLIEMKTHVTAMVKSLQEMENTALIGGFENKLATLLTYDENDGQTYFKSIEMESEESSRTRQEPKNFAEVRKSILTSLQKILTERS